MEKTKQLLLNGDINLEGTDTIKDALHSLIEIPDRSLRDWKNNSKKYRSLDYPDNMKLKKYSYITVGKIFSKDANEKSPRTLEFLGKKEEKETNDPSFRLNDYHDQGRSEYLCHLAQKWQKKGFDTSKIVDSQQLRIPEVKVRKGEKEKNMKFGKISGSKANTENGLRRWLTWK
jgi:hypothetical protein